MLLRLLKAKNVLENLRVHLNQVAKLVVDEHRLPELIPWVLESPEVVLDQVVDCSDHFQLLGEVGWSVHLCYEVGG